MKKDNAYVPYDKASKSEQQKRDQMKRSKIEIPANQTHKSVKDYDRNSEQQVINDEINALEESRE